MFTLALKLQPFIILHLVYVFEPHKGIYFLTMSSSINILLLPSATILYELTSVNHRTKRSHCHLNMPSHMIANHISYLPNGQGALD